MSDDALPRPEEEVPSADVPPEGSTGSRNPSTQPITPWAFWTRVALLPALILLLLAAYKPIQRSADAMNYPYQLDREEGFLLDQAMKLARGESIYQPIEESPYLVGNYPPIYPALVGGLMAFAQPSLPLGRAIVLLAVLAIIAALTQFLIRETDAVLPAVLAIGMFLGTWDVNNWIAFARVDLPAIAFGLWGLVAITSRHRQGGFVLGCLLFTAAFFTKQTQIIAPAAALAGMLWQRDFRRAGLFCVVMIVLNGGLLAFAHAFTNGQFLLHTVAYNANEMVEGQIAIWLKHLWFFERYKLLALLALLACISIDSSNLRTSEPSPEVEPETPGHRSGAFPVSVAFVILAALSLTSTGKAGAAANYLLEFHATVALCFGLALARVFKSLDNRKDASSRNPVFTRVLVVTAIALLTLHAFRLEVPLDFWRGKNATNRPMVALFEPGPVAANAVQYSKVQLMVSEMRSDVLCEEPIFTLLAGKEVLYQPFIMSQLAKEEKWDESSFVDDLRSGKHFSLIVTIQDIANENQVFQGFTPAMRAAILDGYRFQQRIGGYYIYVSKCLPVEVIRQKYV